MKKLIVLATILGVTTPGTLLAGGPPADAVERCSGLLNAARESMATAYSTEYVGILESAFAECDPSELPPELAARFHDARADYLENHEKDYPGAIAAYEAGLEDVTSRTGIEEPSRIPLLEGLASALDVQITRGMSSTPGLDRQRVRDLSREALEVRQKAFGEQSAEAAEGWCWLSYVEQDEAPGLAEVYARTAVEAATAAGDPDALRDALSCLRSSLEVQGKTADAAAVQDRIVILSQQIGEPDEPDGDDHP